MSNTEVNHNYKEPVFIIGMPRSGTTLLQAILCNSGTYFPLPETHFFSRVTYGLPKSDFSVEDRKQIRRVLIKKARIEVDKEFPYQLNSKKEIFEYLIGAYNTNKKNTFLEKTPRHVFFYSEILEYYPDAKFICMTREPKNVVSSILKIPTKRKKSVITVALLYNKISSAILNIRSMRNVLVIKYEDFTDQTNIFVRTICEFLNIPYDSKLVDNVAAPPEIVSVHEAWKNRNVDLHNIQKNDPDRWQKTLNKSQANMVNFITKSYASQFGYLSDHRLPAVCFGMIQDLSKLLSKGELRRAFSRVHG
jgi:hypothetical protein